MTGSDKHIDPRGGAERSDEDQRRVRAFIELQTLIEDAIKQHRESRRGLHQGAGHAADRAVNEE